MWRASDNDATMAAIGGTHIQADTRRVLDYWATFESTGDTKFFYVAVIRDGQNLVGQHEAMLRFDPTGIPAESLVRMDLLRHIDRTSFGEGKPPHPHWIGWHGRTLL